jgi:tetratricopeptide (TPR) repeat protein
MLFWDVGRVICTGVLLACLGAAAPVLAGDKEVCENLDGADATNSACTRIIQSGTYTGTELANVYLWRGANYFKQHYYSQAISDFTKAIQVDPASAFYLARARAYEEAGDYEKAIADLTKIIEYYHENWYVLRGSLYFKRGDYNHAIADYNKAIQSASSSNKASGYIGLGQVMEKLGRTNEAIAHYRKALAIEGGDTAEAKKESAVALKRLGATQ